MNPSFQSTTPIIDFRSDTVTRPSEGMLQAMAAAPVGDDVYRDDPTVIALEERVADLLGKQAGLFVASGTQSNLLALMTHCARGEEYISGNLCHVARYEAQGAAVLGGVAPCHLPVDARGGLSAEALSAAIKPDDPHFPVTRLVCLENTINGLVQDDAEQARVAAVARDHGLSVHLDGARLMNAAVRCAVTPRALARHADTVSLCLSKGLGAPVGSVLSGPRDFIERARRNRKMLGGGMRQAGVLAACGLYALDHNVARLAEDHDRAHRLAALLAGHDFFEVHHDRVETNMVYVSHKDINRMQALHAHLERSRIRFGTPQTTIRLVTHLDIDDAALERLDTALGTFAATR